MPTATGSTPIASGESFPAGGVIVLGIVGYDPIPSGETFPSGGCCFTEKDVALLIRGIDRSSWLTVGSMEVSKELGGRASASFQINTAGHPSRAVFRPSLMDEVVYMFGGHRKFAGFVQDYEEEAIDGRSDLKIHVHCVDYREIAEKRTFARVYKGPTLDALSIFSDIYDATLASEGITFDRAAAETVVVDGSRLVFNDEPVAACYDKMRGVFGIEWFITDFRELKMQRIQIDMAPRVLKDDNGVWRSLKVKRTAQRTRTRQGVRTGIPVSGQRSTTFAGNGTHEYRLGYGVTTLPAISVDAVEKTVVAWEDRGLGPYDFAYETNSNLIRHNAAQAAYTSINEILVTHPSDTLDVVYVDDTAAIARMAARTGGSGIIEVVTNAQAIRDQAMALSFAGSQLEKDGGYGEEISFETDEYLSDSPAFTGPTNWQVGQLLVAYVNAPLCCGLFVIQGLQFREVDGALLRYQVRAQARQLPLITGVEIDPTEGTITITTDYPIDGIGPGDPIDLWGITGLEPIWGTLPVDTFGPGSITLQLPAGIDPGDLSYQGGIGGVTLDPLGPGLGTNGLGGTDDPFGGAIFSGMPPTGGPGGVDGTATGIGQPALVVINVNTNTNEVQVDQAHGWSSSGTTDFRVAIFGCSGTDARNGSSINNPSSRITVTGADSFIMDDVGDLTSATGFENDGHGRAISTDSIVRTTLTNSPNDGGNGFFANGTYLSNNDIDRATFILAAAIPGVASRAIATGSNMTNPWEAQRDIAVIESVTGSFTTPPDGSSAIIDIKKNGVSIFAASVGGLVIPDGDDTTQSVNTFVETPLVLNRGDKLTLDVTQVGSNFPGCGGTVYVNTRG